MVKGARTLEISDVILTWTGESLALPAVRKEKDGEDPCVTVFYETTDPPVSMEIDVPGTMPVLRDGEFYRIGLRVRYINGRSISQSSAEDLYSGDGVSLGDVKADGGWFQFRMEDSLPAPDLLLFGDDPLLDAAGGGNCGETDHVIVLRAEEGPSWRRRVLMPPRSTFDRLELAGVFDHDEHDKPPGAFPEVNLTSEGSYRKAMRSGAKDPVGFLYKLQPPFFHREHPFYPHPQSRRLRAAFVRDGSTPLSFSDVAPELGFWEKAEDPRDAQAIVVEVNRWDRAQAGGRFNFSRTSDRLQLGLGPKVGVLSVDLAPAEEIDLFLWTQTDTDQALRQKRFVQQALEFVADHVSLNPSEVGAGWGFTAQQLKGTLAAQRPGVTRFTVDLASVSAVKRAVSSALDGPPLKGLNRVLKLTLVHAVKKPLQPPKLLPPPYTQSGATASQGPFTRQEGATDGALVGDVLLDAASTGKLRCEVVWEDRSDAKGLRQASTGEWREMPIPGHAEFEIDKIPRVVSNGLQEVPNNLISLAQDDKGIARGLVCPFGDARARRVSCRFIATSRFMHFYNQPDVKTPEGAAAFAVRFQEADVTPAQWRFGLKQPAWNADHGPGFWLLATRAPPPPVLSDIPFDHIRTQREILRTGDPGGGDGKIHVQWSVVIRVHLDRGTWHASGEDELLAIVTTPSDLVDNWPAELADAPAGFGLSDGERARSDSLSRTDLSHFDQLDPAAAPVPGDERLLSPYVAATVTRWAMDPTTWSPVSQSLVPPDAFAGYVAKRSGLHLPRPRTADDPIDKDPPINIRPADRVSILAYRPQLNPVDGRRFVDIGLDTGISQDAFVRLGVARYQPHALEARELSEAVTLKAGNVPSARSIEITVKDGVATVEVRGAGFTQREPALRDRMVDGALALEDYDNPICEMSLRRRGWPRHGATLVYRPDGVPERLEVSPIEEGSQRLWRGHFPLPKDVGGGLEITLREVTNQVRAKLKPHDPDELVPTPGFFACTVAL